MITRLVGRCTSHLTSDPGHSLLGTLQSQSAPLLGPCLGGERSGPGSQCVSWQRHNTRTNTRGLHTHTQPNTVSVSRTQKHTHNFNCTTPCGWVPSILSPQVSFSPHISFVLSPQEFSLGKNSVCDSYENIPMCGIRLHVHVLDM